MTWYLIEIISESQTQVPFFNGELPMKEFEPFLKSVASIDGLLWGGIVSLQGTVLARVEPLQIPASSETAIAKALILAGAIGCCGKRLPGSVVLQYTEMCALMLFDKWFPVQSGTTLWPAWPALTVPRLMASQVPILRMRLAVAMGNEPSIHNIRALRLEGVRPAVPEDADDEIGRVLLKSLKHGNPSGTFPEMFK